MMNEDFWHSLAQETDAVFKSHPASFDHRPHFSWLVGALGNPSSGIWFVAENPSLTQIERVWDPCGGRPTVEAQWWASNGDKLFRQMLVKYGFKTGSIESHGGWNCYITNVIKEADYTKNWREKTPAARNQAAEIWSRVLACELSLSHPKLVVIMGKQTESLLKHLESSGKISLPRTEYLTHYAYIGQRAQGHLGPMHPQRIQAYDLEFTKIRTLYDNLS